MLRGQRDNESLSWDERSRDWATNFGYLGGHRRSSIGQQRYAERRGGRGPAYPPQSLAERFAALHCAWSVAGDELGRFLGFAGFGRILADAKHPRKEAGPGHAQVRMAGRSVEKTEA